MGFPVEKGDSELGKHHFLEYFAVSFGTWQPLGPLGPGDPKLNF